MNINLLTSASSTHASSTPESEEFAEGFFDGLFKRVIAWFADTANGIQTFFAKEVKTEQLCIKKSDGADVCVDGDQLANLLAGQGSGGGSSSAPEPEPEPTPEPEPAPEPNASSTPPTPEPTPEPEPQPEPTPEEPTLEEAPAEEPPAEPEPAPEPEPVAVQ
jgi:hypothetical protein